MMVRSYNYRADQPKGTRNIVLNAVGDIGIAGVAAEICQSEPDKLFGNVRILLNEADILTGNFEFPVSESLEKAHEFSRDYIVAPKCVASAMRVIRWSVLGIANNHIADFGLEGIESTKAQLKNCATHVIGAGKNLAEASKAAVITVDDISFGFLAYSKEAFPAGIDKYGPNCFDLIGTLKDIRELKKNVDHVIVHAHWGTEYSQYPSPDMVLLAEEMVKSGASVIIGHHPHTLQGLVEKDGSLIAYSLGNFIMDPALDTPPSNQAMQASRESIVLHVEFSKVKLECYKAIPIILGNDSIPLLARDDVLCRKIRQRLEMLSNNINSRVYYENVLSGIGRRSLKAWLIKIRMSPIRNTALLIRTAKLRHIKMILLHMWYKLLGPQSGK